LCTGSPGRARQSNSTAWNADGPAAPPLDDEHRLEILRGLLHDHDLDPRDRFAGSLVLLFGQPLTRIAKLRRDDLIDHGDRVAVRLGREPVELPDPLARIAIDLRANHAGRARVAAADSDLAVARTQARHPPDRGATAPPAAGARHHRYSPGPPRRVTRASKASKPAARSNGASRDGGGAIR
jgi:hypothetical protein